MEVVNPNGLGKKVLANPCLWIEWYWKGLSLHINLTVSRLLRKKGGLILKPTRRTKNLTSLKGFRKNLGY